MRKLSSFSEKPNAKCQRHQSVAQRSQARVRRVRKVPVVGRRRRWTLRGTTVPFHSGPVSATFRMRLRETRWLVFLFLAARLAHSLSNTLTTIPQRARILVLPGFGNDAADYFLEDAQHGSLVQSLRKRGWSEEQIRVLSVSRGDWLQVFWKGIFDLRFWVGRADPTRPAYQWYLARAAEAIRDMTPDGSGAGVVLLCHSAGGWLGRAVCGFGSASAEGEEDGGAFAVDLNTVLGIVTLGSPHLPPPPTVMDMTRGALRITNDQFPGAHHNSLFYITVAGSAVTGVEQIKQSPMERTTEEGYAYRSYEIVCGDGESDGDGIVPLCSAHLDGATQLTLENVYHSINKPDRWYGSHSVVSWWHGEMLHAIHHALETPEATPRQEGP